MQNRRVDDRVNRTSRIVATTGIAVPVSILTGFALRKFFGEIPAEVSMAVGALVGAVVACFHDVLRYAAAYVIHRFKLPRPPEDF